MIKSRQVVYYFTKNRKLKEQTGIGMSNIKTLSKYFYRLNKGQEISNRVKDQLSKSH
jgi:hypothetical protein